MKFTFIKEKMINYRITQFQNTQHFSRLTYDSDIKWNQIQKNTKTGFLKSLK